MASTLQNKLKKLPAVKRKKIVKRVKNLIAEEMTLRAVSSKALSKSVYGI